MSLNTIHLMHQSESLQHRIAAAASKAGVLTADQWSRDNMLVLVSSPGWEEAWDYATDNYTKDYNPDTGERPGVIDDGMIVAAVQARIDALVAVEPEGGTPSWFDPTKKKPVDPEAKAAQKGWSDPEQRSAPARNGPDDGEMDEIAKRAQATHRHEPDPALRKDPTPPDA